MDDSAEFRKCFTATKLAPSTNDYVLLRVFEGAYAARSRNGLPALIIPLEETPAGAVGRRSAGCELVAYPSLHFAHSAREWDGPAAALICNDVELLDAFAVLAADVIRKTKRSRTWRAVLVAVEEWLALLAPRGRPSVEVEIGLWGELWFLARAQDAARILAAWRGPEGDNTDFFLDGLAAEVKTSRVRHQHFVSQMQVVAPVGGMQAWLLSIWVKVDPAERRSQTVPALVEAILERSPDRAEALRRITRAGYSPANRKDYTSGYVLLEEPTWFASSVVPRVRLADPGVSRLRYHVSLDHNLRADAPAAARLWLHFHSQAYEVQS